MFNLYVLGVKSVRTSLNDCHYLYIPGLSLLFLKLSTRVLTKIHITTVTPLYEQISHS